MWLFAGTGRGDTIRISFLVYLTLKYKSSVLPCLMALNGQLYVNYILNYMSFHDRRFYQIADLHYVASHEDTYSLLGSLFFQIDCTYFAFGVL